MKKILSIILVILLLLSVFSVDVQAVQARESATVDEASYQYCKQQTVDTSVDYYTYDYRTYNCGGMHSGTFNISKSIVDGSCQYFVFCDDNGELYLYYTEVTSQLLFSHKLYLKCYHFECYWNSGFVGKIYLYSKNSNQFELKEDLVNKTKITFSYEAMKSVPSSIILSKGDINVQPLDGQYKNIKYNDLFYNKVYKVPQLYEFNDDFRLYLQDYHDSSEQMTDYAVLSTYLKYVYMYVYDFVDNRYTVEKLDVLVDIDNVKQDDRGQYYLDINKNLMHMSTLRDCDYLIAFASIMQSNVEYTQNDLNFISQQLYNDASYFRYKYYSKSRCWSISSS